jgi:hypothetical protein
LKKAQLKAGQIMGKVSEMAEEFAPLREHMDYCFHVYNSLIQASSPATRTPAQEHEIHEARQRALNARDILERHKFWNECEEFWEERE